MAIKHISAGTPKGWTHANYNGAQEPQFYSKTIDYINCIPQLVGVATREGLKIYPEYSNVNNAPYFIIRIRFKFRSSIKTKMIEQWRAGMYVNTDMQHIIQDQWISVNDPYIRTDLYLEYKIHESQIVENGGIVYIPAADCTVGIGPRTKTAGLYHPYTEEGNILESARVSLAGDLRSAERSSDYCFHVRIVDNAGSIGTKWISYGPFVSKVKSVKHPGVRDGFYVTRTVDYSDDNCNSDNTLVSEYYERQKDVKCVTIADTYAEAKNAPSFEAATKESIAAAERRARIEELDIKLSKNKLDIERDELRHKMELEKIANELRKIMEERDRYSAELEFLKEKLKAEKISLWRKFIGDTLKYVPVIIATTITVYKMFRTVVKVVA